VSDDFADELAAEVVEDEADDSLADSFDDPGSTQAEYPGAPTPLNLDAILQADLEPSGPTSTPVAVTSEIINGFKEDWGEDESASLQKHWGDQTLANQSLTRALVEDHTELQAALDNHLDHDNGLSLEGAQLVGEFIAERAGYRDIDAMLLEHPEIGHIFNESFNENSLSASGTLRILHYVAEKSNYRYTRKHP
jgi:hypothetical protein